MLHYEMYLLPRLNRNKKNTPVKIVFTFSFICKFSTPIPFHFHIKIISLSQFQFNNIARIQRSVLKVFWTEL